MIAEQLLLRRDEQDEAPRALAAREVGPREPEGREHDRPHGEEASADVERRLGGGLDRLSQGERHGGIV